MYHLSMKVSDKFDPNQIYTSDKIVVKQISVKETLLKLDPEPKGQGHSKQKNKARKKKLFDFWKLVWWPGGPFFFFLNHIINIPNHIVKKILKHEILYLKRSCSNSECRWTWITMIERWRKYGTLYFSRCCIYFAARIFFICVKIDPPDDQNKTFFFLA